jgi:hypothetical protein
MTTARPLLYGCRMQVGPHEVLIEAPDLVVFWIRGDIAVEEIEVVAHAIVDAGRGSTAYVMSVIVTPGFDMSGNARKRVVEITRGVPKVVDAIVGGDFRTRIMARLVEGVARAFSKMIFQVNFCDDEASARAWLRAQGCVACGAMKVE